MYIENKDGLIDGVPARIGWVDFSNSGKSIYYRGRTLLSISGGGKRGNFIDEDSREEYWISGVKSSGSNVHPSNSVKVEIDANAVEEYRRIRGSK